ncbi:MAG: ester cyclase [Desulfobacteraceae bacterium]|nr:ester cyclase [Desulfobacteraceae bacterium]
MKTRDWLMTKESLLDKDVDAFEDLSAVEKENLKLVMTELKGWATQSVDMVLSVMAEDGVYYDITGEPAVGHDGIREFGLGWVDAVPDFKPFIEAFVVQGNKVVNMGRISGSIQKEFFGLPATGKKFDCQYCQVAFIENGKIKYVRDHWNLVDMYYQVGWDVATLAR